MSSPLQVLWEDNHCLAVVKPAGVLTMGDRTGDETMVDLVREYLRTKYHKPGNVFVGVVHRLDRPVSGILLFARTSKAASRLSEQFRNRTVRKIYRALVEGHPESASGELTDRLTKSSHDNRSRIAKESDDVASDTEPQSSQEARLRFRCLKRCGQLSLLEIELLTGRSHQIRVQLASRGTPICGDAKYGARSRLDHRIALHAAQLEFQHPTTRETITLQNDEPAWWHNRLAWNAR